MNDSKCLTPTDCEWASQGWCPRCEPATDPSPTPSPGVGSRSLGDGAATTTTLHEPALDCAASVFMSYLPNNNRANTDADRQAARNIVTTYLDALQRLEGAGKGPQVAPLPTPEQVATWDADLNATDNAGLPLTVRQGLRALRAALPSIIEGARGCTTCGGDGWVDAGMENGAGEPCSGCAAGRHVGTLLSDGARRAEALTRELQECGKQEEAISRLLDGDPDGGASLLELVQGTLGGLRARIDELVQQRADLESNTVSVLDWAEACAARDEARARLAEVESARDYFAKRTEQAVSPADENGVRSICIGYHEVEREYEWLRVVPESVAASLREENARLKEMKEDYEVEQEEIAAFLEGDTDDLTLLQHVQQTVRNLHIENARQAEDLMAVADKKIGYSEGRWWLFGVEIRGLGTPPYPFDSAPEALAALRASREQEAGNG